MIHRTGRFALVAITAIVLALTGGQAIAGSGSGERDTLEELADALIETDAVGTLDKLAIQSQVDSLAQTFYHYHDGRSALTLADLRARFDTLHGEIVDRVAKGDSALAREVKRARDRLWRAFADPDEFANGVGSDITPAEDQIAKGMSR